MSNEEFEKWATQNGFSPYDWPNMFQAWRARQPEMAAKDKTIDDLALQKGLLKAHIGRLESENAALQTEVERLRKDAERYRFQKKNLNFMVRCKQKGKVWLYQHLDDGEPVGGWRLSYDEAVDDAMKQEEKP